MGHRLGGPPVAPTLAPSPTASQIGVFCGGHGNRFFAKKGFPHCLLPSSPLRVLCALCGETPLLHSPPLVGRAGARRQSRQFPIEENHMDMTDLQRRWWFANHPEFSCNRTRSRPLGRRHGNSDLSNTALANERLRKENFIQKMMDAGWKRPEAEKKWKLFEDHTIRAGGVGWAVENYLGIGPARRLLTIPALSFAARRGPGARPPRLPPKGTPERANIEAARKRGERARRREELTDIGNDGAGSGVWTKKELQKIRKTKEFPRDTVWHHEPSVANRPKLADDPRAVSPIRGGRNGALEGWPRRQLARTIRSGR